MTTQTSAVAKTEMRDEIFRIISIDRNNSGATTGSGKKLPRTRLVLQNGLFTSLNAVDWNCVLPFQQGDVVKVSGSVKDYKGQPQLTLTSSTKLDSYDPAMLLPRYQGDVTVLEQRLRALLASFTDARLSKVARKLLDPDTELGRRFRLAPAAPVAAGHEPYIHGLSHHLVEVAETALTLARNCSTMRPDYSRVNLDFVLFGALLHDLGKTTAYVYGEDGIKFSEGGRLNGHLLESYSIVREALKESGEFNPSEIDQVLHLIASHHGPDSDQPPRTIEALIVHTADHFCSELGSKYGNPHNAGRS